MRGLQEQVLIKITYLILSSSYQGRCMLASRNWVHVHVCFFKR